MTNLEGFALRLPPAVKAAAVALSKVHSGASINDVLNRLILCGMQNSSEKVNKCLKGQRDECEPWKDIAKFFLENPAASHAVALNFDAGSAGRKYIDHLMEIQPDDFPRGIDRQMAMEQLASLESEIWRSTKALDALQAVLV